jgi:hypothetical protein
MNTKEASATVPAHTVAILWARFQLLTGLMLHSSMQPQRRW